MKIELDKWVVIDYTLKNEQGEVIDTSVGKEALGYLHGNGFIIPGLEKQLEGKEAGDKINAVVPPAEAYGEYDEALLIKVPRDRFEGVDTLEIGMNFQVQTPQGPAIVHIVELGDDLITIDGNHELAGKTLYFDVEVKEVRDATEEELNLKNAGCGGCGGGCGGDCSGGCGNCGDGGCGGCGN